MDSLEQLEFQINLLTLRGRDIDHKTSDTRPSRFSSAYVEKAGCGLGMSLMDTLNTSNLMSWVAGSSLVAFLLFILS